MRITHRKKIFFLVTFCIGIVLLVCNMCNKKNIHADQRVDIYKLEQYEKSTKDRYIAAIMLEKGISYDEAKLMEERYINKINISENQNIRYATLEKSIGTFFDGENNMSVNADIEMRYVYEKNTGEISYLTPVMIVYIPNISDKVYHFSAGECNVYEMSDYIRLSNTVIGIVKAEGDEKNDLDTTSTWSEQYRAYVITKVKTYSTKVLYSELQ